LDDSGGLHWIVSDETKAALEALHGKLVEVESRELPDVFKMNREQRRAWYKEQKRRGVTA
jgi:hypothetical protein